MYKLEKGAIAICSKGITGVINSDKPDKNGIWHGMCLFDENKSWQSKHPVVIGRVHRKGEDGKWINMNYLHNLIY